MKRADRSVNEILRQEEQKKERAAPKPRRRLTLGEQFYLAMEHEAYGIPKYIKQIKDTYTK